MNEENVKKVNNYLKKQLWMEFEICKFGLGGIELHGSLDNGYDSEKIFITFEFPYMMDCQFFFTYEGSNDDCISIALIDGKIVDRNKKLWEGKDFMSIVNNSEEAWEIIKKYKIPKGYEIFKLSYTDAKRDMIIAAKDLKVEIFDDEYK